jgi:hypothetical protein
MAQKTLSRETARMGLSKSHKAMPVVEGAPAAKAAIKVSKSARQEYPEVNAAIDKGLADIAAGRVHRMSFAEYADISVED